MNIDALDKKILKILQGSSRLTNAELADKVGLSASACHRRIKSLEEQGYIRDYATLLDPNKVGYPISVLLEVTLSQHSKEGLQAFERDVVRIPQVMECYFVAGDIDYHLRVVVRSTEDYERLYLDKLAVLPNVQRIKSMFAMRNIVRKTVLPI